MRIAHPNWTVKRLGFAMLAVILATAGAASAQSTPMSNPPTKKPVHHRAAAASAKAKAPETVVAAAPAPAPEPPKPDWPVNDRPEPATVTWDSQGLMIDASNSSLKKILQEVSTDTGTTVEGLSKDERVFGTYGPGAAHDVISQLLQGYGYNIVMVGDQGNGTPRQIVLTERMAGSTSGSAKPAQNEDDESEAEPPQGLPQNLGPQYQIQVPPGVSPRQIFNPLTPVRTPQQIMQERMAQDPNNPANRPNQNQ